MRGYKLATVLLAFAGSLYGGVDLIVDSINLSTDPVAPGDVVPITVTISNVGDSDVAGGTEIAVELTSTLANAGSLSMSTFSGIAAGATTTVDFSFLVDEADLNGSFPISIEVDPANTIVEDSDANNGPTVMGSVLVDAFANLVPDGVNLGAGPFYPGDLINVEVEYSNSGQRGSQVGFRHHGDLDRARDGHELHRHDDRGCTGRRGLRDRDALAADRPRQSERKTTKSKSSWMPAAPSMKTWTKATISTPRPSPSRPSRTSR